MTRVRGRSMRRGAARVASALPAVVAVCVALAPGVGRAQGSPPEQAPPEQAPAAQGAPREHVGTTHGLPAGHPTIAEPEGADSFQPRVVAMPDTISEEAPGLPPGVVLVRVVDADGRPVPEVPVRLGVLREGERQNAHESRTRADGVAQFDHLEGGNNVAYRPSVDHDGARFGSPPFALPGNVGWRVQLVRYDVEHQPRAVLIANAGLEIGFRDDRLIAVMRLHIANFSNVSIGGSPVRPYAFVPPREGVRFRLPIGYTAFTAQDSMGDQHVTEENGFAVLRGSIPPTAGQEPVEVTFQFHYRIRDTSVAFDTAFPLRVLRAGVAAEAPRGMRLDVDGMPVAEEREHNGQRFLSTHRERTRRDEPEITELRVRLSGIPPAAGPERTLAALLAGLLIFASLVVGTLRMRVRGDGGRVGQRARAAALVRERDRILHDVELLCAARRDGDVGPETYERRRRELTTHLARVLSEMR